MFLIFFLLLVHQVAAHGYGGGNQQNPQEHNGHWLPHWPHWPHWDCPPCWNPFYCPPCTYPTYPPPPPPSVVPTNPTQSTTESTTQTSTQTTTESTTQTSTQTTTESTTQTSTTMQETTSQCIPDTVTPNECRLNFSGPFINSCNPPTGPSLVYDCFNPISQYINADNSSALSIEAVDVNCVDNRGRRFFYNNVNTTNIIEAEQNNQSVVISCVSPTSRIALCTNTTYCCEADPVNSPDEGYLIYNATLVPHCDQTTGNCTFYADVRGSPDSFLTCTLSTTLNTDQYILSNQNPNDWNTYLKVQYVACSGHQFVVDANC